MKTINLLLIGLLALNCCGLLFSKEIYVYGESGDKLYFQKTDSVKFISLNSTMNVELRERIKQSLKKIHTDNFQEQTPLLYKITLKAEQEFKLFSELQKETKDVCISSILCMQILLYNGLLTIL